MIPLLREHIGGAEVWCSARASGNIADHTGDDLDAVARNRRALAAGAGLPPPDEWVWVRQVHGPAVHVATGPATTPPEADAVVTTTRRLPIVVVTADCAPLVVASDDAVAVVHAGHRGLREGVVEAAITYLRDAGAGELYAFLGPCIRAQHYEFGADALAPFAERFGSGVCALTHDGRHALDIPAAIRVVLEREGVASLEDCGIDTAESDAYFSYRRDATPGRQATIAWLP